MIKILLTYLSGTLATSMISIFKTFLLTRIFSPQVYGISNMIISISNMLIWPCLIGMDQVYIRNFYEKKHQNTRNQLLLKCLTITALSTVLTLTCTYISSAQLLQTIGIQETTTWIYLLPFAIILNIIMRYSTLIARLLEKAKTFSFAIFLEKILFLIVIISLALGNQRGIFSIILSYILSITLTASILIYSCRSNWQFKWNRLIFNKQELLADLKYGFPFVFSASLTWALGSIDKILLLKWTNPHELGLYSAAFSLASPLALLRTTFRKAWTPKLNQLILNNPDQTRKKLTKIFQKTAILLVLTAVLLIIFKDYLFFFLGKNFYAAKDIFPYLLFAPIFSALSEITIAGFIATKKSYWNIPISLFAVLTNIVCCRYLIPTFGAKGAAISLSISMGTFFMLRTIIAFRYYCFKINITQLAIGLLSIYFIHHKNFHLLALSSLKPF